MTFTYESPPVSDVHKVRFWSTDTVEKPYSVSDEDIAFLLAETDGNVFLSAAFVCDRIAGYFSTTTSSGGSKSVGPFSVDQRESSELEDGWRRRAAALRIGTATGLPTLGGGIIFTGDGVPEFSVGMQDNGIQAYPVRSRAAIEPPNGVW